jgi:pimeloyl-ACP methyl ester carboxylesterase
LPEGRSLQIHVAVVSAEAKKAASDPIVLLMGGPGEEAISAAAYFSEQLASLLTDRDFLLIDQRGTGRSSNLKCQLYSAADATTNLQDFFPLAGVKRCRDWAMARADLSQYSYKHHANDMEYIRRALGYGSLNLFSASYGTRAAQTYLRMYPQHVRTVYLGSVVPVDVTIPVDLARTAQLAMERTFGACDEEAACRAAFPELRTEFAQVLHRLDAGVDVKVAGFAAPVRLTRGRFAEFLRAKLYRAAGAATVPWLIHQAWLGNWSPIAEEILAGSKERDAEISFGLFFSIACNDDIAFIREADVTEKTRDTFVGDYRVQQQQAACREWPKRIVGDTERRLVSAATPALFSSGDIDPASPLWFTDRVAQHFPNRLEVVLRDQGHTEWNDCLGKIYEQFVRRGGVTGLEATCQPQPRPPFKTR